MPEYASWRICSAPPDVGLATVASRTLLAGADWTVTGGETTRKYSVHAKEGELYLLMHQPGFGIILR